MYQDNVQAGVPNNEHVAHLLRYQSYAPTQMANISEGVTKSDQYGCQGGNALTQENQPSEKC